MTDLIQQPPEFSDLYQGTATSGTNDLSLAEKYLRRLSTPTNPVFWLPPLLEFTYCTDVAILYLKSIGDRFMDGPELLLLMTESVYVLTESSF
jgi:hypothetical protein